jgi:hypothetical protein
MSVDLFSFFTVYTYNSSFPYFSYLQLLSEFRIGGAIPSLQMSLYATLFSTDSLRPPVLMISTSVSVYAENQNLGIKVRTP